MKIIQASTAEDVQKCWAAMSVLRPHLAENEFVPMVLEMMQEGYQLAFVEEDGQAAAAIGYRYLWFLYNGKHFYIDDLVTLPEHRGKGYAGALLDFVADEARKRGFDTITLDSGHHRFDAHRLYLNKGFNINSHHFVKKLN